MGFTPCVVIRLLALLLLFIVVSSVIMALSIVSNWGGGLLP